MNNHFEIIGLRHRLSDTICEVHIWKYDLRTVKYGKSQAREFLSEEDLIKADSYTNMEVKERFISVHIFLRKVLSRYIPVPPNKIRVRYSPNNKPFLSARQFRGPLYFNLAYRENFALLGVSNSDYIGVDIEKIRRIDNIFSLVINYFSLQEQRSIVEKENMEEQLSLLFTLWVMKEAVLKAIGNDFSEPLHNYNMYPFLRSPYGYPNFDRPNAWFVWQINIDEQYRAALAIRSDAVKLSVFEFVNS